MASPGTNPSCVGCHEGRAAIRRFSGQSSNFVELSYPVADNQTITCAVCHDPHGSPNTAQLRAPITSQDIGTNLCMQCHNRNSQPSASYTVGSRGAHSSQGGVYLGQGAGWYPPGFAVDTALIYQTTHLGGNPRLCAGCHVVKFDVTDPETGAHVFSSTGHLFSPNPCLDANGVPNADNDCAYNTTTRSWAGCATSGCHTATAAAALFNSLKGEVDLLVGVLWTDLNGNHTLDPSPTDGGYLAIIRANYPGNNTAAFCCTGSPADNVLSAAEGALFNAQMLGAELYDHNDGSHGVHNSAFYKAMLAATITSLQNTYTLPPASSAVMDAVDRALRNPAVRYARPGRVTAAR
jgi:predicted CXXCH cytochrome family protein